MRRGVLFAAILLAACGSSREKHPASSFAYVGNNDQSSVSVFKIDPGSGLLTLVKTVATATANAGATYCELSPSGRFLFVSGEFGNVLSTFTMDANGMPAPVAGVTVPTGSSPHNLSFVPDGRVLYVANVLSNDISAFSVAADGSLQAIAGSPFAAGTTPYAIKVADSGKFAYAANRDSNDISAYSINATTGALTPIPGQPFKVAACPQGCGPRAFELSPDGKLAFVPNRFSNDVTVFAVNTTTGTLAPVAGSPFAAGTDPRSAAVDPAGRYLYVPNVTSNDISAFAIDAASGKLTALAGSPFPAGRGPLSLEIDESGQFVYVANSASNEVSMYRTDAASGRLTSLGNAATAGSAFSIALK